MAEAAVADGRALTEQAGGAEQASGAQAGGAEQASGAHQASGAQAGGAEQASGAHQASGAQAGGAEQASGAQQASSARGAARERWVALGVLCAGFLMIILDTTIVSVAQPAIARDLGLPQSGLAWIVNAYLISFGGLLLLAGRLGDLIGRKRMFLAGLSVFTTASLLCGLAQSEGMLIAARFVQGIGGAMTSAVILGMVVALFPAPAERGRAIAIYAFVGSAGASLGTLLGGVLTDAISWHWIFVVNVPIGVATAIAASRVLADEQGQRQDRPDRAAGGAREGLAPSSGADAPSALRADARERLGLRGGADAPGGLLVVAALMLGVFTIVEAESQGFGSARTLGTGAVALALLAAFVAREARARQPLVPLWLFRVRNLGAANLVQAVAVAGMFGQQFLVALYFGLVLDYSPVRIGLAMLPIPLMIGVVSLGFCARLMTRFGAKATLLPGLGLLVAGLALMARVPADAAYAVDVLPALLIMGVGAGLTMPAISTLAMAGAAPADAGLASGLANTTQQVGAALGLAVLSTLSATRADEARAAGAPIAEALTAGYRFGFAVAAGLALAALALAAALLKPER